MYGPKYVWIITGWYTEGWWDRAYASTDCTAEQLALAAEGAIGTGPVYINPRQERGVAGLTSDEWLAAYLERIDNQNFVGVPLAAMGYDAAWATAMALNFTDAHLTKMGLDHVTFIQHKNNPSAPNNSASSVRRATVYSCRATQRSGEVDEL